MLCCITVLKGVVQFTFYLHASSITNPAARPARYLLLRERYYAPYLIVYSSPLSWIVLKKFLILLHSAVVTSVELISWWHRPSYDFSSRSDVPMAAETPRHQPHITGILSIVNCKILYFFFSILHIIVEHQHSPWARLTKSKPKRGRGWLLARASTIRLLMETASTRNSQVVVSMQRNLKLLMMIAIDALDGATNSGNCATSRCNLATALYHNYMLPTPS